MSEAVWENAVSLWLTRHRGVFINPSYGLGPKGDWACIDLLALDFSASTIWAVEVTSAAGAAKIEAKAAEFDEKYAPLIMKALESAGGYNTQPVRESWKIGLWAFVRNHVAGSLRQRLATLAKHTQVTDLEDTAFIWSYWTNRFTSYQN